MPHSPAPWTITQSANPAPGSFHILDANGVIIAVLSGPEAEENARYMAASPKLAAALQTALRGNVGPSARAAGVAALAIVGRQS